MNLHKIPGLPSGYKVSGGVGPDKNDLAYPELDDRSICIQCHAYAKEVDALKGSTAFLIAPCRVDELPPEDPTAKQAVDVVIEYIRQQQLKVRPVRCSACGALEGDEKLPTQKFTAHTTRTRENIKHTCFEDTFIHLEWPHCRNSPTCYAKAARMARNQMIETATYRGMDPASFMYPCSYPGCRKEFPQQSHLKRCGGCKTAQYCNADCQRADWPKHSSVCRRASGKSSSERGVD